MVRGMPLNEMHFSPTSRWSSAAITGLREWSLFWAADHSSVMAEGEFIVIAVAVENVSHAGVLTEWDFADSARRFRSGWRLEAFGTV